MASLDEARSVLANAFEVGHKICGPAQPFFAGGITWVWDGTDPQPGGSWHCFGMPARAVDPNAALYLDPNKIDRVRHEAEVLLNAFPATERRLEDLGCDHVELVHEPIKTEGQVLLWSCSVFNAATPLPFGWSAGYTNEVVKGVRDWPAHVYATAQQVREAFVVTHITDRGRVAVLPVEERCAVLYWAEPGSWYEEELVKLASQDLDMVLPPKHPLTIAAYHSG